MKFHDLDPIHKAYNALTALAVEFGPPNGNAVVFDYQGEYR